VDITYFISASHLLYDKVLTTDLDGCLELEEDRLADEDFTRFRTEILDLVLLQLDRFSRSVASDWLSVSGRMVNTVI
jgi:hypothetical protein